LAGSEVTRSASTGQAATHLPHAVQRTVSMAGSGGPPRRGVNRIACSGQASAQDWQCTNRRARHVSAMATGAGGGRAVRNPRRVVVMRDGPLGMRRPRWAIHLLIHPDREAPAAHDADGDDRPDQDRQNGEHQQFRAAARGRRLCGHDCQCSGAPRFQATAERCSRTAVAGPIRYSTYLIIG